MRTLIVLICSLALVTAYGAEKQEKKSQQKKPAQTSQRAAQPAGRPAGGGAGGKPGKAAQTGRPAGPAVKSAEYGKPKGGAHQATKGRGQVENAYKPAEIGKAKGKGQVQPNANKSAEYGKRKGGAYEANRVHPKGKGQVENAYKPAEMGKAKGKGQVANANKPAGYVAGKPGKAGVATGKPFKPQHFNVAKQPNMAKAPAVTFQQGRRIQGSQNWHGAQYNVFRNYQSQWHDQNWWHSHYHNNIVFVFGAPYYWNAGYWFPAWGYNPGAYYAWDGPIYAYNHLPPDQVIANVQAALQQQGYYHGDVDGLIGPLTRGAIADYQRDHGLYITSAIDQPTLQSLGMV
jgi:hypothetical protein